MFSSSTSDGDTPPVVQHLAIHTVYVMLMANDDAADSAADLSLSATTTTTTTRWALHSLKDLAIPEDVLMLVVLPSGHASGAMPAICEQLQRDHELEFKDDDRRRLFFVNDGSEEVLK
jgi:hypothetical protein